MTKLLAIGLRGCSCGALLALAALPAQAGKIGADCTWNGTVLHGTVQVVTSFPDIKVQKVTSFPDLRVQEVTSFPDNCGQWQFVTASADFTIQYVDSFPDIQIEMVDSFPGVP